MATQQANDALSEQGFEATATALNSVTSETLVNHTADPQTTLHAPSDHKSTHAFLRKLFPETYINKMEADYHMGNYVIDRYTGEKSFEAMSIYVRLGMHLLYYGSEQSKLLQTKQALRLLEEQSVKMGKEYDEPESRAHIQPFVDSFQLQSSLAELKQPDLTQYPNFNAFFSRELKPDARPVQDEQDPLVVCSVADCRLTAFPTVDLATKYWIKGFGFTLERLLGSAELAQQFEGGSIVIARLAPQDYHRWHSPVDGVVEAINDIPGAYYTVNPQAINEPTTLDVFCENKRSVMLVRRSQTSSPVAIIAVGAMLVGSILYQVREDGTAVNQPGAQIRRGECLGAFQYGGSTVIALYPKGEIVLDEDLVRNSTEQVCETVVKVGWSVGRGPA